MLPGILAFLAVPLFAAETVIVPYDASKPLDAQTPNQLYVPYDSFIRLWESAKKHRREEDSPHLGLPYALTSARYDGTFDGDLLRFTGFIELSTFDHDWIAVPLAFDGVTLGDIRLDGAPAVLRENQLLVEKPGAHRLEVSFAIPAREDQHDLAWRIPRTAGTMIALTLPRPEMRAEIKPGSGSFEQETDGVKRIVAALGETDRVSLHLDTTTALSQMNEPAVAFAKVTTRLTPALETSRAQFDFSFPKAEHRTFSVHFDKACTLVDLEGPGLATWRLVEEAERNTLEVTLAEPVRDDYRLTITTERRLPPLPATLSTPAFSAEAARNELSLALFASLDIDLQTTPAAATRRIAWPTADEPGFRLVEARAASQGTAIAELAVKRAPVEREAEAQYVYQVNRTKIDLIASLTLDAGRSALHEVTLALPAEFDVQAVQCARLDTWWRDGDALRLRLTEGVEGRLPLVVYLVRQFTTPPERLEIVPLKLAGFVKVTGEAIIAAHKGVEAKLAITGDAREIDAADAAKDFTILPPLERQRAFSFKTQDFAGSVALAPRPARLNGLWVMLAEAHEGWVAVSARLRLTMREGSVDRARFSLPAEAPEARVTGSEVRETTARVEGDRRIYEVAFQNDVVADADFTIELELPHDGSVALPALELAGMERTEGFVLAQNVSDYEMELHPAGLDLAPRADVPVLPDLSQSASVWRARPGWSLKIEMAKLEKTAGRAAFVAWAEMTGALRPDGTEWHRAVYHLQNRSLQFLPVALPAGAELAGARVAGRSVRADAGEIGGRAVVLVPLIKTGAGDLAYDVELVWRRDGGDRLGWLARRTLDDPDLVGVTVERTLWNVWLPDGHELAHFSGNMEPVIEEIAATEKLEGALQELKALTSVLSSSRSQEVRKKARYNYDKLAEELQTKSEDNLQDGYKRSWGKKGEEQDRKLGKGKAQAQREETTTRNRVIQQELSKLSVQLKEADVPGIEAAETLPNQAAKQQGWKENAAAIQPEDEERQAKETRTMDNNLYVTDSVVVQQKVLETQKLEVAQGRDAPARPGQAEGKGAAFAGEESAALRQQQSRDYLENESAPMNAPALVQQSQVAIADENSNVALNTARGARGPQSKTKADGTPPPLPQAVSATRPAEALPANPPDASDKSDKSLKPTGRIALAVDFPTEGRVFHFKKVKAHATLTLAVTHPASYARLKWLALFGVLGLVLASSGRIYHRR